MEFRGPAALPMSPLHALIRAAATTKPTFRRIKKPPRLNIALEEVAG